MAEKVMQAEPLTRDRVMARSEARGEPGWLRERRAEAWQLYEERPFPDPGQDEPWRRTPVRLLKRRLPRLDLASDGAPVSDLESLPDAIQRVLRDPDKRGGLLVRRDDGVVFHELDEEYSAQGVKFMELGAALREVPELVERALASQIRADEGKFEAMHAALMSGGVFLYVPRGVTVERTLQVVHWVDGQDIMLFPHTVVLLEDEGVATLMEEYLSEGTDGTVFVDSVSELVLGTGAQLVYLGIQAWGENVTHFHFGRSTVAQHANLNWTVGQFGGKLTRFQTEVEMAGSGGTAMLNGVFFPTGEQHHGNYTLQLHTATHCTSDLLFKGALRDKSRSVYEGGIKVAKGAQQTDAYQANRNLMLSPTAHADSIPSLEIEAHEVRCTHGSTTSQIDQEELFYAKSRGIESDPATKLVVQGFFIPVLDRIPLREVRSRLRSAIQQKMSL